MLPRRVVRCWLLTLAASVALGAISASVRGEEPAAPQGKPTPAASPAKQTPATNGPTRSILAKSSATAHGVKKPWSGTGQRATLTRIASAISPSEASGGWVPENLRDPGFDRYVDLALLCQAWEEKNASALADVALQFREGERVLLRPHRAFSSQQLLQEAARIAVETKQDEALQRLNKIAEATGDAGLKAKLAGAQKLAGPARATDPALQVSIAEMTPEAFAEVWHYLHAIRDASLTRDTAALKEIQDELSSSGDIPEKQKKFLQKLLQENQATAAAVPPWQKQLDQALDKLSESSRRGGGGGGGGGGGLGHAGGGFAGGGHIGGGVAAGGHAGAGQPHFQRATGGNVASGSATGVRTAALRSSPNFVTQPGIRPIPVGTGTTGTPPNITGGGSGVGGSGGGTGANPNPPVRTVGVTVPNGTTNPNPNPPVGVVGVTVPSGNPNPNPNPPVTVVGVTVPNGDTNPNPNPPVGVVTTSVPTPGTPGTTTTPGTPGTPGTTTTPGTPGTHVPPSTSPGNPPGTTGQVPPVCSPNPPCPPFHHCHHRGGCCPRYGWYYADGQWVYYNCCGCGCTDLAVADTAVLGGLWFENLQDEPVMVAIVYYDTTKGPTWMVTGWYVVEPGERVCVMNGNVSNQTFYYYAFSANYRWEGDGNNHYVDPKDSFSYDAQDPAAVSNAQQAGYENHGFNEIDVGDTPYFLQRLQ